MTFAECQTVFSFDRLNPYLTRARNNQEKALSLYLYNIQLCQALYTSLSVLEVALRNKIDIQLQNKLGNNWFLSLKSHPILVEQWVKPDKFIREYNAKNGVSPAHGKIVAEMTFGYWSRFFQAKYETELWKDLSKIFPNIEKSKRRRRYIETHIQPIVIVRNRAYHYECICSNFNALLENHKRILDVVKWMDVRLYKWLVAHDPFPGVYHKADYHLNNGF